MPTARKTRRPAGGVPVERNETPAAESEIDWLKAESAETDAVQDDRSTPHPAEDPERVYSPVEAAARVLVRRALDAEPGLREFARAESVAIVVEVNGAAWVNPIAEAWRKEVWCTEDVPEDGDEVQERPSFWTSTDATPWLEYRRQGESRSDRPDIGNAGVSAALAFGRPVYGFAPAPERHLPRDLLRAADRRITIPPLDPEALIQTASLFTGDRPTASFPEELARLVTVDDLWLARRPKQDADDYLARLRSLVAAKVDSKAMTLDCLHGMDEAVAWGRDLARDIDDYRRGKLPWSSIDRGALLTGDPGTGKTTFARALAATCGVPLVAASLSQWQAAGHLGDLLKAMRKSFEEARALAPSILFVDETDSFGDRSSFSRDHKDYGLQVVNGFLEELDGVAGREGVVILGACNNPNGLDPAITRPGRLDRVIHIPKPDRRALALILRHHLGQDLAELDLSDATLLALGGTGADCELWVRGARRRARHGRRAMTIADLVSEIRGSRWKCSHETLRRCAIHEAGHALVGALERPGSVVSVSIRQNDESGGSVISNPWDGQVTLTRSEIASGLRLLLAGRAAEDVLIGSVSTGAGGGGTSDLAKATCLATAALCSMGLAEGEVGLLWLGMPTPENVGPMLAASLGLARQVSSMLADAYEGARDLVRRHAAAIGRIADLLVERETLEGADVESLIAPSRRGKDFSSMLVNISQENQRLAENGEP